MRWLLLLVYSGAGAALYGGWAYAAVERSNFGAWLVWWLLVWLWAAVGWRMCTSGRLTWWQLAAAAMGWRLLWGWTMPLLSDDFWRFLWDGHLLAAGESPFAHTPRAWLQAYSGDDGFYAQAFPCLNSPDYYSLYPPLSQLWFYLGAVCGGESIEGQVWALRLWLWLAECAAVVGLWRWLRVEGIEVRYALLWLLNPFVIVEFSGNLHFELVQAAFLFWAMYFWRQGRFLAWSLMFGAAVLCKLIPLLLMPIFFFALPSWRWRFGASALIGAMVVGAFLPLVSVGELLHIAESLRLYVDKFAFNASAYYFLCWLGELMGWQNAAAVLGTFLYALLFFVAWAVAWWSWRRAWRLEAACLLVLVAYYALTRTLHPWYWLLPLCFSLTLPRWRFWALFVAACLFLSYATYARTPYAENMPLLVVQYACIFAAAVFLYYSRNTDSAD